jgi:hypothetical protein
MAAEQIEREKAIAQVERERVLTQLESAEADRDEVLVRLRESEERERQERERTRTRARNYVVGLALLSGVVAIFLVGSFGGGSEVAVPVSTPTTEPTRVTTSATTTTTTLEPTLPVDPEAAGPVTEIDEVAVLTATYEMWETGERVQVLQIVLGIQADWIYGPTTYGRHTRELIDRRLSLSTLPAPPTTTSEPLPPYVPEIGLMYPNEKVRDFKHPGQPDEWVFFGSAGTSVGVQMTSRHFDTYLKVIDPGGVVIALNDDHDGTNSFVSVQLCHTGVYTVIAGSYGYGSTQFGEYALLLTGGDVVFDAILQKCEAN